MPHTLLLGSQSASRQMLLREAKITFIVLEQKADERACDWSMPIEQLVQTIARMKMEQLIVPDGTYEGQKAFILTADTLSRDSDGAIQGKPSDRHDARAKLIGARGGSNIYTGFCLQVREWRQGTWVIKERIEQVVAASYLFDVPDAWIDVYLENSMGLSASNAIAVEGYGTQFLKRVDGSFSTIVGLPMFEVREALEKLGFFDELLGKE